MFACVASPAGSTDTLATDRMTLSAVTTMTARLTVVTVASRRTPYKHTHTHTHTHSLTTVHAVVMGSGVGQTVCV